MPPSPPLCAPLIPVHFRSAPPLGTDMGWRSFWNVIMLTFGSGQIYAVSRMTGRVCCLMPACEQALPSEMRACNNHWGKSVNAHLTGIYIIYKPNQSYSSGSLGENPSYKAQSKNVNITLSIFTWPLYTLECSSHTWRLFLENRQCTLGLCDSWNGDETTSYRERNGNCPQQ